MNSILDGRRPPPHPAAMPPRRNSYEPLALSKEPRWIVVRNMHRTVLVQQRLEPGTDLYGAYVKAMAAHADAGWQLESFSSSHACVFCSRSGERRSIAVESDDPGNPTPPRFYDFKKVI
jgi:hypothetical protein